MAQLYIGRHLRMNLRSGKPFWTDRSQKIPQYLPLARDVHCEVIVLGGGITGALVAQSLVRNGFSVVLLDNREIGYGSTAASTGLLQYEVDTPLIDLIKKVGEKNAVHAYRRGLSVIDEIETLVRELETPCGFSRRDTLYFASHFWHRRRLERNFNCLRTFGFDVEYVTREELREISSIHASGAIRSRGDAQIDPFAFTQALMADAVRLGLEAHSNTGVTKVEELDDRVNIRTDDGYIQAEKIVYATGYDSGKYLDKPEGDLNSTYAVTSQANLSIPGWPENTLIWETARPYFYARRTDDGRAMIGGADSAFSTDHKRDVLVNRRIRKLVRRFQELFPQSQFVAEYAWAGTFAETKDGLAYIGQPDDRPRAYFALGYGGNGITFSIIAAKLISDLVAGRPNADAGVFRFGR
jgi:glycine/D-amino acid oxidase-like deaminating enzyme